MLGFTCHAVRGFPSFAPCLEHVCAGGGGGSVAIEGFVLYAGFVLYDLAGGWDLCRRLESQSSRTGSLTLSSR